MENQQTSQRYPHFHQAALASAFTLSIVSPLGSWATECEIPVANPLVVNITTESEDPCDDQVSLREAIAYANSNLGKDTITFTETLDGQTIYASNGSIFINDSLTITGNNEAELTTLKANDSEELFRIEADIKNISIELSHFILEKIGSDHHIIGAYSYGGDINLEDIHIKEATNASGILYSTESHWNVSFTNSSITSSTFSHDIFNLRASTSLELNNIQIIDSSAPSLINFYDHSISMNLYNIAVHGGVWNNILDIKTNRFNISLEDLKIDNISAKKVVDISRKNIISESLLSLKNSIITGSSLEKVIDNTDSVYSASYSNIAIENSTISGNALSSNAISFQARDSNLSIISSEFCNNKGNGLNSILKTSYSVALDLSDSRICNNGFRAIDSSYSLAIDNSLITNNHSRLVGTSINFNLGDLDITNSSFTNNTSEAGSGGISLYQNYNYYSESSRSTIVNTTVSGNRSNRKDIYYGGGIRVYINDPKSNNYLEVQNSTIVNNMINGFGGGIAILESEGSITVNIENSIIAKNVALKEKDLFGHFQASHSLIEHTETLGETSVNGIPIDNIGNEQGQTPDTQNNILGQDPLLQSLSLSGPSWVHQLTSNSPAIGAGDTSVESLPEFDQRGNGFPRLRSSDDNRELDMGAVQYYSTPVAVDDTINISESDSSILISVLSNDTPSSEGDPLVPESLVIMDHPANGTAETQAYGLILYTPDSGFIGSDSFTYLVQDNKGISSSEGSVRITVTKIDEVGSSLNFWLLSLFGLFGLRRKKQPLLSRR